MLAVVMLSGVTVIVLGSLMSAVAFYGIVRKRVFVFSMGWLVYPSVCGLLVVSATRTASVLAPLAPAGIAPRHRVLQFALAAGGGIAAGLVLRLRRGYVVLATTDETLDQGIFGALSLLGVCFERSIGSVEVAVPRTSIRVKANGEAGWAYLWPSDASGAAVLRQLAMAMNWYYSTTPHVARTSACFRFMVVGGSLALFQAYQLARIPAGL